MVAGTDRPVLEVLSGNSIIPPPIWFMRQAGRYLPEYREIRARAGGFLDLCLNPDLAAEVTLQPIRRFGLDAAIIFSDILVVPYALGVKVWFLENEGPRLEALDSESRLGELGSELDQERVEPVYAALKITREILPRQVTLIGFCGAPWTVATYLIAGRGGDEQSAAKALMRQDPAMFGRLIDRLVDATAEHLIGQLRAGADVVQLFDTWAGALDAGAFERWCIAPCAEIVRRVRNVVHHARVIVFPKGAPLTGITRLVEACGADAVSLGAEVNRRQAVDRLGARCALQGNLDPQTLLVGGPALDREVDAILEDFRGHRHIFNLGHGILKETPTGNVERMIARVRR